MPGRARHGGPPRRSATAATRTAKNPTQRPFDRRVVALLTLLFLGSLTTKVRSDGRFVSVEVGGACHCTRLLDRRIRQETVECLSCEAGGREPSHIGCARFLERQSVHTDRRNPNARAGYQP